LISQIERRLPMTIAMRRIPAMLLMALFSFWLIGPAVFASGADSNLPECCRRGGKHHCAMTDGAADSSSGPALLAARCCLFPQAPAVPLSRTATLPGSSRATFVSFISRRAPRPQTLALRRISYSREGQKRGPPTPVA
jgi:hypothetical protein